MLGHDYFYNSSLKKTVALFGALFNDIYIGKAGIIDGDLQNVQRVPLSYGPRDKFLARINEEGERTEHIGIKLPRMSFVNTDIAYDSEAALNPLNRTVQYHGTQAQRLWQATPYNLSFELSIMARSQDEALQIVEQIIPFFKPSFTVTAKDMEGPDSRTDVPITLTGVGIDDSYAGALDARRTVIYTLSFNVKVQFQGPASDTNVIKAVEVSFLDTDSAKEFGGVEVKTSLSTGTKDDHELVINFGSIDPDRDIWPDD